ncbi:MAG TPA: M14 family metallopeptidase [Thermoanaerobaculaceae bacterium]|nr:M14 family metallopeptidase [Thermoanaerobaculaceae bacterium]
MKVAALALSLALAAGALAAGPATVVESTNYSRTSLYREVVDFVNQVARTSDLVTLATLATTAEGRAIPLVVLSKEGVRTPAELRATGKPAVLVMANIHGGEIEGKEACQILIREIASGREAALLDHQVILVIPIFNADGNDKLGHNRHDNGPELAGVRYNGQMLDLNRDYTKLESPEVRGLVRLLSTWDPVLFVDMHTTNGSYHREPVTYTTCANANCARSLTEFMWTRLFPAAAKRTTEASGFDTLPYGEFVDGAHPEKGWLDDAIEARYGTNYVGLRNRLTILDENYSYAEFKTRVQASLAYIGAVLEFTNANASAISALVRRADTETAASFAGGRLVTETAQERRGEITVKGWEFTTEPLTVEENAKYPWMGGVRVKPTGVPHDYTVPWLALTAPVKTIALPAGYVVVPGQDEVVRNLLAHGIVLQRLAEPCRVAAERWVIEKVEPEKTVFQGHVLLSLPGHLEKSDADLPAGSVFVDMRQPLARVIAVLLEPASADSLAAWGFLDRSIVRQWSNEPAPYPVLRVAARPPVPLVTLGEE